MTHVDIAAKASIIHNAPQTRLIAGVSVADSPLVTAVIEYERLSEPYLFNHAMRSSAVRRDDWRAEREATTATRSWTIGTILHDIGLTASVSGPNRFEVNGADAALSFIKGEGLSDRLPNDPEWTGNQTPQPGNIARRMGIACDDARAENRQAVEAYPLNRVFF